MPDSLITVTSAETRRQLTGAVKVNRHIAQVAVVNAHHLRLQDDGALQFLFIADFGQHAHIQAVSHRRELTILFIVEHREHQQTGVGLIVARRADLVRVDGEVLTQDRLRRDWLTIGRKSKLPRKYFSSHSTEIAEA